MIINSYDRQYFFRALTESIPLVLKNPDSPMTDIAIRYGDFNWEDPVVEILLYNCLADRSKVKSMTAHELHEDIKWYSRALKDSPLHIRFNVIDRMLEASRVHGGLNNVNILMDYVTGKTLDQILSTEFEGKDIEENDRNILSEDSYSISFDLNIIGSGSGDFDYGQELGYDHKNCYTAASLKDVLNNIDKYMQKAWDASEITKLNLDDFSFYFGSIDIQNNGEKIIQIPVQCKEAKSKEESMSELTYLQISKAKFLGNRPNELKKEFYQALPETLKNRARGEELEDRLGL